MYMYILTEKSVNSKVEIVNMGLQVMSQKVSEVSILLWPIPWQNQPFDPLSDQHLISPYNITPESYIKVLRI